MQSTLSRLFDQIEAPSPYLAVGERDRFLDAVEAEHAQHRPEYFLLRQRAFRIDIDGDARRQIEARLRHLGIAAVESEADAFFLRAFHPGKYLRALAGIDDGAEIGAQIERIADRERARALDHLFRKTVGMAR
jgi:hypothetical protein